MGQYKIVGLLGRLRDIAGKDIARYSSATIVAQLVQMGCNFAVLAWLSPAQMGIWLALQAAEAYSLWIRLGVVNAMNLEYPYLMGQGRVVEAQLHVQTTAIYMAVCSAVLGLAFLAGGLLLPSSESNWPLALVCYSVHAAGSLWRNFIEATFRGGQDFARLVRLQLGGAGLQLLSLFLVPWWGFTGFCMRAALLAVVLTTGWHLARPIKLPLRFNRPILLKLFREGMPLFVSNYLSGVTGQIPRTILLLAGGAPMLGLYAPISALLAVGLLLPSTLLTYLLPRQNFEFGSRGNAEELAAASWRRARLMCAALLPIGIVGWLAARTVVTQWMPEYARAIPALGFASAVVVLSPVRFVASIFSTLKAWWPMMVYIFTGLSLSGILSWAGWQLYLQDPLQGVVAGILCAQLLQVLVAWVCVRWAVRLNHMKNPAPQPCIPGSGSVR
jgi:O-antigen/teichoic acid export membrane protein